jgi:oligoribonuclease NrnB/cAMP/cGMP phosphodiesterase (DHH superfamily)
MKTIIVYHADCVDGAMAAAVVYRSLKAAGHEDTDIDMVPAVYQKPMADFLTGKVITGSVVFIVDFSFSPKETADLIETVKPAGKVVVLDHHKTTIEKFAEWGVKATDFFMYKDKGIELFLDLNHSGAALAWRYFHSSGNPPQLVQYVEDYDLWRHKLDGSKAVHAYLTSLGVDVGAYVHLLDEFEAEKKLTIEEAYGRPGVMDVIRLEGFAILRANKQQMDLIMKSFESVVLDDKVVCAVNSPVHQSELGERLAMESSCGLGVVWYWGGYKYNVSLRSAPKDGKEPVDCASLAAQWGGGGHKQAAGFTCDALPWEQKD